MRDPFDDPARISAMGLLLFVVLLAVALSGAMALAWMVARRPGRSGWTDVVWSSAVGAAGVAAALVPIRGDAALGARRWLVAVMVATWAIRLGSHIARRAAKGRDDPRYLELRRQWGGDADARLFWFLQIQALCALPLALSAMAAARAPAPTLLWSDAAGAAILLLAVLGEGVADRQLRAFAADPAHANRVCDSGLWAWSRHPNYLFETLAWLAYPVIALGAAPGWGWGYVALAGPALIYALLAHVSGVPPLEAHMMRSRGAAFRAYADRVPAFWPRPPGRNTR